MIWRTTDERSAWIACIDILVNSRCRRLDSDLKNTRRGCERLSKLHSPVVGRMLLPLPMLMLMQSVTRVVLVRPCSHEYTKCSSQASHQLPGDRLVAEGSSSKFGRRGDTVVLMSFTKLSRPDIR